MRLLLNRLPLLLAIGLALPAVAGETLSIEPGLWRTRSTHTMEMPGMPKMPPRSGEHTECIADGSFDPRSLFAGMPDCTVSDIAVAGSVMTFRVVCPSPQGRMSGEARYESHGDRGNSEVTMQFQGAGFSGRMHMTSEAERVGDCPE